MENYRITEWCSHFIREQVNPGDLCVDATMGNGNDTLLLSRLCGEKGRVLAFDIQKAAVEHTARHLSDNHAPENYRLILDSHENMAKYLQPESVSCMVFNLGYLPGGDHQMATRGDSSVRALQEGIGLLKKGGMISLCIYSGGDSGFEERDAVLKWLVSLDPRRYLVIKTDYYNRPNHPPIPVLIIKL